MDVTRGRLNKATLIRDLRARITRGDVEPDKLGQARKRHLEQVGAVQHYARAYYMGTLATIGRELRSPQVTDIDSDGSRTLRFLTQIGAPGNASKATRYIPSTIAGVVLSTPPWRHLDRRYARRWLPKSRAFWRKSGVTEQMYASALEHMRPALLRPTNYIRPVDSRSWRRAIQQLWGIKGASGSAGPGKSGQAYRYRSFVRPLTFPNLPSPLDMLVRRPFLTGEVRHSVASAAELRMYARQLAGSKGFQQIPINPASLQRMRLAEARRPWVQAFAQQMGKKFVANALRGLAKTYGSGGP